MSVQVENLEKNMAKLTIEVPAEKVEEALQAAYMKQKNRISVPGFRKGKVPRTYFCVRSGNFLNGSLQLEFLTCQAFTW